MTKAPATAAPSPKSSQSPAESDAQDPSVARAFIAMGVDMSWRLALGVLIPVLGGVFLDNRFKTGHIFLLVGFAIAIGGTVMVIRRTVQAANQHPTFNKTVSEDEDD